MTASGDELIDSARTVLTHAPSTARDCRPTTRVTLRQSLSYNEWSEPAD